MKRLPFEGIFLVCDMDGTLLDRNSRVSRENSEALKRFTDGGGIFTVATGRMESTVAPYLEDLPVNAPAILYNGAVIFDFVKKKTLWENNLRPDVIRPIKLTMERFPNIGVQIYHGGRIYFTAENEYTEAHRIREGFEPIRTYIDDVPWPWRKVLFAWHPERLKDTEAFLNGFDGPFGLVYSEPQFLELLNLGVSKGSALKVLAGMLRVPETHAGARKITEQHARICRAPERHESIRHCAKPFIIAMGDNLNDVELIKAADIGIAVANAHEKLKAAADILCARHDQNAVAEVIGRIEEGKIPFDYGRTVINDIVKC